MKVIKSTIAVFFSLVEMCVIAPFWFIGVLAEGANAIHQVLSIVYFELWNIRRIKF